MFQPDLFTVDADAALADLRGRLRDALSELERLTAAREADRREAQAETERLLAEREADRNEVRMEIERLTAILPPGILGRSPRIAVSTGLHAFFPGPEGFFSDDVRLRNEYYLTGAVSAAGNFSESLGYTVAFERDSILMNRIFTRASWDAGFFGVEAGPYLGLLNTGFANVSLGVSLLLKLTIPQWRIFTSFRLDIPITRELSNSGDYNQSFGEINIGYRASRFRIVLSAADRRSILKNNRQIPVTNQWVRYNLGVEFPPFTLPLTFGVDGGYEELYWTYDSALTPFEYRYYDVYAGIEAAYTIGASWTLVLGVEVPVYPFRYPDIGSLADPRAPFLGKFNLGFRWTP
ncbi:MAG: hypothetical protein LBH70_01760 [Spirochaetaceae bacterium]|jgi:hypothetical protein|nr:hypothetical protein [Spirochaetaceae bacterium]